MPVTLSATESRIHFGKLLDGVSEHAAPILVEKDGEPVVAFMDVALYEFLAKQGDELDWKERARRSQEIVARA